MNKNFKIVIQSSLVFAIIIFMYYISRHNYLLFHMLAEFYSILIAFALFIISYNTKKYSEDYSLLYLGTAYLFIAFIDLLHTISYKGMNVFLDYEFHANQLWIAARFMESISLLLFALFFRKNLKIKNWYIFLIYSLVTTFFIWSIFFSKIFPICFIENQGQTNFKIYSEYIIILILTLSALFLFKNKTSFSRKIFTYLILSIGITIASELCFTLYTDNYGITNVAGHLFKILSFYLIYKSIIETGLTSPFSLIFSELKARELELQESNRTKDKFFSIIGHDLKNPIGAISEMSRYLKENISTINEEDLIEDLDLIKESADFSKEFLDNVLLWARSQTGRLEKNPQLFQIFPAVEAELRLLNTTAFKKNISFINEVDRNDIIFADRNMFALIVRNLLSNALKFSYSDSEIKIISEKYGGDIKFSIIDSGTGMSKKTIDNIFGDQGKVQSIPGTAKESGTGLGLMLCREFVYKNGGNIWLKSKLDEGTSVFFTMPTG